MLVVFPLIFVADTKLIYGYNFVATFKKRPWHRCFPVNFVEFCGIVYRIPLVAASDSFMYIF